MATPAVGSRDASKLHVRTLRTAAGDEVGKLSFQSVASRLNDVVLVVVVVVVVVVFYRNAQTRLTHGAGIFTRELEKI